MDSVEALELRALKASEANKALRTQQEAEAGSKKAQGCCFVGDIHIYIYTLW